MPRHSVLLENSGEAGQFIVSITPDWPTIIVTGMIGLGSILTAASVAYISKKNQQSQNLAKKAELRQDWINRFTKLSSEFVALCLMSAIKESTIDSYRTSDDWFVNYQKIITQTTQINLMINSKKNNSKKLLSLINKIVPLNKNSILTGKVTPEDMDKNINAFSTLVNLIIDDSWNKIKNELS